MRAKDRTVCSSMIVLLLSGLGASLHSRAAMPDLHVLPGVLAASATSNADFADMIAKQGPAVVTLKFVLEAEGEEKETEATGTMIAGDGLVLVANDAFGGIQAIMMGVQVSPKNIKVYVGDDQQGVEAKLIARDSELNLAWLKTGSTPEKPYAFVDFAASAEPKVGENLFVVQRMGKFFGRELQICESRVGSIVSKPRTLYIPTIGTAGTDRGMAAFAASGKVLGVTTFILPEREEMQDADQSLMKGVVGGMVLPAKEVVDATKRALETAKNAPPEAPAAEKPKDAPTAPAIKEEPKPVEPAPGQPK